MMRRRQEQMTVPPLILDGENLFEMKTEGEAHGARATTQMK